VCYNPNCWGFETLIALLCRGVMNILFLGWYADCILVCVQKHLLVVMGEVVYV
jgi:hypothetical protein